MNIIIMVHGLFGTFEDWLSHRSVFFYFTFPNRWNWDVFAARALIIFSCQNLHFILANQRACFWSTRSQSQKRRFFTGAQKWKYLAKFKNLKIMNSIHTQTHFCTFFLKIRNLLIHLIGKYFLTVKTSKNSESLPIHLCYNTQISVYNKSWAFSELKQTEMLKILFHFLSFLTVNDNNYFFSDWILYNKYYIRDNFNRWSLLWFTVLIFDAFILKAA
jgi:hypothetical protein